MRSSSSFNNLCILRHQLGITQAHLAAASGVSEKTIKRAESGTPISSETRMAISAAIEDFRLRKSHSKISSGASNYVGPVGSMRRSVRRMVGWAYLQLILLSTASTVAGIVFDQQKTAVPFNLALMGFVIMMIVMGVARLPFGALTSALLFIILGPLFLLTAIDTSREIATQLSQNWIISLEVPVLLAYAAVFIRASTKGTIFFIHNQRGQGLRFGKATDAAMPGKLRRWLTFRDSQHY